MTASVAAAEVTRGQNINFKFAHQMSMIEIKVPIRAYKTSGGYEYSAPLGLKVTMAEESAAEKNSLYVHSAKKQLLRMKVK